MALKTIRELTADTAPPFGALVATQDASSGDAKKTTRAQFLRDLHLVRPPLAGPIASVSSGGSGTLTLANITGALTFNALFGSSGVQLVPYLAIDAVPYTQWERGWGHLDLATLVLTRTKVIATWNGSALDVTSPSKLTLSTSTLVEYSPAWDGGMPGIPFQDLAGTNKGLPSAHVMVSTAQTVVPTVDVEYYIPFQHIAAGEINAAALHCATGQAGGAAKMAIYRVGTDGLPGAKIANLASGTPFDLTSNGNKVVSVTGLYLLPGWYYIGMIFTASSTLPTMTVPTSGHIGPPGHGTTAPFSYHTKAGNYTTGMPDPASASLSGQSTITNCPCPFLRTGNT